MYPPRYQPTGRIDFDWPLRLMVWSVILYCLVQSASTIACWLGW